jgi:serine/threonine-protein kinase RsbW
METHASAPVPPDGKAPSACAPSRLSIPNDPFYVEPTCRYAAEVAHQIGFDAVLAQQISAGLRQALTSLLRYSFEPGEKALVELVCERIPAGLRISLRDRGLPLSAGDPGSADVGSGADNPLYGLNDYFDEVHFHNRGPAGKEIVLCKHLPDPSLAEYAAACALDTAEASDAERPGAPAEIHCTVRPLKASEAHEVSKAVYTAYGYSYPHEHVYYPEKIAELNRRGEIFSVVAVADNGEIAGHCSLQLWEENPCIAELTQGVVKPRFRSQGCFARLTEYLIETARTQDLTGVFGEAVTAHPYSQRAALQFGLRDCALFLGLIPATAEFKGLKRGGFAERGSMLVQFRHLKVPPPTPVFAPAAHRAMIAAIYANLGITPDWRSPSAESDPQVAEASAMAVKLSRALNLARIRIDRWGPDAIDILRRHVKELCLHQRQVIHLLLGLADPATAVLAQRCEELGFFFAGVLPCGLPSGDALILQYLNNFAVRYEALQTASEFAARLAAYVQKHDPSGP